MLPPVPSKHLLCIRAVSTMVFDKVATETVDSNLLTISQIQLVAIPNPDDTLFMIMFVYSAYVYYKNTIDESRVVNTTTSAVVPLPKTTIRRISKRTKLDKFNKFVLSDTGYHLIKIGLLILCLLIKDPMAAV